MEAFVGAFVGPFAAVHFKFVGAFVGGICGGTCGGICLGRRRLGCICGVIFVLRTRVRGTFVGPFPR